MVLLIIIPTFDGYFIGGLEPIFRHSHITTCSVSSATVYIEYHMDISHGYIYISHGLVFILAVEPVMCPVNILPSGNF